MFLFKRIFLLSAPERNKIKDFVGITMEKMLITKEETLNILKQCDMVLISSLEESYLVIDIYQLSKFTVSN